MLSKVFPMILYFRLFSDAGKVQALVDRKVRLIKMVDIVDEPAAEFVSPLIDFEPPNRCVVLFQGH